MVSLYTIGKIFLLLVIMVAGVFFFFASILRGSKIKRVGKSLGLTYSKYDEKLSQRLQSFSIVSYPPHHATEFSHVLTGQRDHRGVVIADCLVNLFEKGEEASLTTAPLKVSEATMFIVFSQKLKGVEEFATWSRITSFGEAWETAYSRGEELPPPPEVKEEEGEESDEVDQILLRKRTFAEDFQFLCPSGKMPSDIFSDELMDWLVDITNGTPHLLLKDGCLIVHSGSLVAPNRYRQQLEEALKIAAWMEKK